MVFSSSQMSQLYCTRGRVSHFLIKDTAPLQLTLSHVLAFVSIFCSSAPERKNPSPIDTPRGDGILTPQEKVPSVRSFPLCHSIIQVSASSRMKVSHVLVRLSYRGVSRRCAISIKYGVVLSMTKSIDTGRYPSRLMEVLYVPYFTMRFSSLPNAPLPRSIVAHSGILRILIIPNDWMISVYVASPDEIFHCSIAWSPNRIDG